jgi:hypothetical protein
VRRSLLAKSLALSAASMLLLTGCSIPAGPNSTVPGSNGTARPTEKPRAPFFPTGSAEDNLPVFKEVLELAGAGTTRFNLEASIFLLVEAGFSLDSITHTSPTTKIQGQPDSISLGISFAGECLVGQFSTSWLTTDVLEPTKSGCLIGKVQKATLDSN